jgi:hypothetical protein
MVAGAYAGLGRPDSAVYWIERALTNPAGFYTARALLSSRR